MPILKAVPAQAKNETLQLRVPQDLKFRLTRYAEFTHATASYVVSEAPNASFARTPNSNNTWRPTSPHTRATTGKTGRYRRARNGNDS